MGKGWSVVDVLWRCGFSSGIGEVGGGGGVVEVGKSGGGGEVDVVLVEGNVEKLKRVGWLWKLGEDGGVKFRRKLRVMMKKFEVEIVVNEVVSGFGSLVVKFRVMKKRLVVVEFVVVKDLVNVVVFSFDVFNFDIGVVF